MPPVYTPETREVAPPPVTLERAPRPEASEQSADRATVLTQATAVPIVPQLPVPPLMQDNQVTSDPRSQNPLVADDVDVIEKQWVDRAKKIIQETKDDPYQKEQEVSRLQADYLQKRFGVQVKLPQG